MRQPWILGADALRERLIRPGQVPAGEPDGAITPYLASFLAHLRLLVGVPFDYLVPDDRMLPNESVRFFHVDRSWTDRLVDGVFAVGKLGTREQAHHQSVASTIQRQSDGLESGVRAAQRGDAMLSPHQATRASGGPITGLLLRSALVRDWPHLEVRASAGAEALAPLRIERLAGAVLIALWDGIADTIEIEEPHHGVQFGLNPEAGAVRTIVARKANGDQAGAETVPVDFRDDTNRVIDITALRERIGELQLQSDPAIPAQTGSAAFAIELLTLPWMERFADHELNAVRAHVEGARNVSKLTLQLVPQPARNDQGAPT